MRKMERSEPALVPEWYKLANGSTSNNALQTSSTKRSDINCVGLGSKSRFRDDQERNLRRSLSSNGSINRDKGGLGKSQAYNSFRRSRDRNQDIKNFDSRDRENRSLFLDSGLDYLDSFLGVRAEKDALRRSQSMIAGRQGGSWPKKFGSISKTSFEKDFPSLRSEGRQGFSDAAGLSPIGLRTAVQSLPIGSSIMIGTSALAEVPVKVEANGTVLLPVLQATPLSQASTAGSTMAGLNMAEALTQAPSQACSTPQLSVDTPKIEELTLKKCKQLIPMTPSMPKVLNGNSSDKAKPKIAKSGDFSSLGKVAQQGHTNLTIRLPTRVDIAKTSPVGNFQVLNRDKNEIAPATKDGAGVGKTMNSIGLVPSATVPSKSPSDQKTKVDKNGGEKKLLSHARNRNDFFNLLRKKSMSRSSASLEPSSLESASSSEKSEAENQQIASPAVNTVKNSLSSASDSDGSTGIGSCLNGDFCASDESERFYIDNGETNHYSDVVDDPEEEAFLQSLGWDKNAWEEALTKEEIDAFLKKYEKQRPLKIVPEDIVASNFSGADS
ncbi:hypothetical protein Cni_G22517 [Canna indica]|uniref:Uncharacterized protein n=1 Tax=Canna indica TaxID=4628 RepID=A0AAQ3QJM4_9LILI|nr:hypothetical protein Cni_G22517 [Canna indica]